MCLCIDELLHTLRGLREGTGDIKAETESENAEEKLTSRAQRSDRG